MFFYLNVDEVPLLAVVESKLVLLWSESLVVVEQSLHLITQSSQVKEFLVSQYFIQHPESIYLSLGQLRMAVVNLTVE